MKKFPPRLHLQNGTQSRPFKKKKIRTPDGSEMARVQNSSYQIEPTGGAQEYEHKKIGQVNFHCEQMLLYYEAHHVKK